MRMLALGLAVVALGCADYQRQRADYAEYKRQMESRPQVPEGRVTTAVDRTACSEVCRRVTQTCAAIIIAIQTNTVATLSDVDRLVGRSACPTHSEPTCLYRCATLE